MFVFSILSETFQDPTTCGGAACPCAAASNVVARYSSWSTTARPTEPAAPNPAWLIHPPDPRRSQEQAADFPALISDRACGCSDGGYVSFDIAGDMFFLAERAGPVHVHRKSTGDFAARLFPGAEVDAYQYWVQPNQLQAVRRSNGEYLVTTTDHSNQARNLVFRWKPPP
jgi:hypothetical protein